MRIAHVYPGQRLGVCCVYGRWVYVCIFPRASADRALWGRAGRAQFAGLGRARLRSPVLDGSWAALGENGGDGSKDRLNGRPRQAPADDSRLPNKVQRNGLLFSESIAVFFSSREI